jgi:protein TonB
LSGSIFSCLPGLGVTDKAFRKVHMLMKTTLLTWTCLLTAAAVPAFAEDPRRVSTSEALAAVVTKVQPEYPAMAKQLKLAGTVELDATVAEDGTVENVKIVSGNPVFTKPTADVLKKWKFKPFTTDGKPSKVVAVLSFSFKQ